MILTPTNGLDSTTQKRKTGAAAAASFQRANEIEVDARRCELLAGALSELRRWPDAEAALRRAVTLAPDNARFRVNWAAVIANMGKLPEALQLLEKSLEMDPENSAAREIYSHIRQRIQHAPDRERTST